MKSYPAYKDSTSNWLGEVPAHWEEKRLKFVAMVNPSRSEIRNLPSDLDVSFYPMEAVGFGALYEGQIKSLGDVSSGFTYFRDDDILIAKITPSFENGKGALATGLSNGIGFGTTELHVIRPTSRLNKDFLFYLTYAHEFRHPGEGMMDGTAGQKRIPNDFLLDYRAAIPPLSEQTAIATYLDRKTAQIDAVIARKERLIELLREERTAVISQAVTKGINPHVPMKDSGVAWLGEVPAHWEMARLRWSVTMCKNGIWGSEPEGEEGTICVRVADFDRERSLVNLEDPTLRLFKRSEKVDRILQSGDLLLEKSGGGEKQPVGFVVLYNHAEEAVCSNFIARMPVAPRQDSRYWNYLNRYLYFVRVNVRSIKQTTGIQNLDSYSYLCEQVPYPPLDEQIAIVEYLEQKTIETDQTIARTELQVERLREYRTALISAVVTGKVDVREEVIT